MPRNTPETTIDESGNGERMNNLVFDLADAPMLMHAMMIAANTVMMCSTDKVEGRMRYYQRMFRQACPSGHEHLRQEEDLCDIVIAMVEAPNWSIHRQRQFRSSADGNSIITVGSRTWETANLDSNAHNALLSWLAAIAPIDCLKVYHDDIFNHAW